MLVLLNEDIGCREASGQRLPLPSLPLPFRVSFHLMKSNSSFTPLNSATFFPSLLALSGTSFSAAPAESLRYGGLLKEINRFNPEAERWSSRGGSVMGEGGGGVPQALSLLSLLMECVTSLVHSGSPQRLDSDAEIDFLLLPRLLVQIVSASSSRES